MSDSDLLKQAQDATTALFKARATVLDLTEKLETAKSAHAQASQVHADCLRLYANAVGIKEPSQSSPLKDAAGELKAQESKVAAARFKVPPSPPSPSQPPAGKTTLMPTCLR